MSVFARLLFLELAVVLLAVIVGVILVARAVTPESLASGAALAAARRIRITCGVATALGLAFALWGASTLPLGSWVGATTTALWVWSGLLAVSLMVFGTIAEPDGRSLAGVVTNGEAASIGGPFPGWAYGAPMLAGAAVVVAATFGVLHVIARRPAVWAATPDVDSALRRRSATLLVKGAQLSLATSLFGELVTAGMTAANQGWWWGVPAAVAGFCCLAGALAVVAVRGAR